MTPAPATSPLSEGNFAEGTAPPTELLGRPRFRPLISRYAYLTPPAGPDELGRLGEYRILRLLASGGMGLVFEAEDIALRRPVALKVMKPDLEQKSSTSWERFLREARAMAQLRHENLVSVYQVGQEGETSYIAMELLNGQTLEDWISNTQRASISDVYRIAREIALGLEAIHGQGLIHRDIKPSNIWIERGSERAKILDFGLVREIKGDPTLTETGVIVGTPAYLSPEQARGRGATVRSDLFSLGCVLYTMCTRKLPFSGQNTLDQLAALVADSPRPVNEVNPTVPEELSDLVMQLLAKSPEDRPESARAVVDMLDRIQFGKRSLPIVRKRVWPGWKHLVLVSVVVALLFALAALPPWLANFSNPRHGVPADALVEPPADAAFLCDMEKLDPIHWPFLVGGDGRPTRIIPRLKKPVEFGGTVRPRSIHMHPTPPFLRPASLSFRLDRNYETFSGHASLADGVNSAPSVLTFAVFGDGNLLWRSRPVLRQVDGETFSIDVRNVDVLKIQTEADGHVDRMFAAWIDPFLTPKQPRP